MSIAAPIRSVSASSISLNLRVVLGDAKTVASVFFPTVGIIIILQVHGCSEDK